MIFTINNKKILFIHIPKTAGTTIENFFLRHMKREVVWPKYYPDLLFGYYNNLHYQHLTMEEIAKINKISDFNFIFCVVRDPFYRFISECNWSQQSPSELIMKFKKKNNFCHYKLQYDFIKGYEKYIKIYKYEDGIKNIVDDIIKINKLDIKNNLNPNYKNDIKKYTIDDISLTNQNKIKEILKKDFEYFNYNSNSLFKV